MNRLIRLVVASGAGLALALTASPALAAPPSDPGSNRARVEHTETSNSDRSYSYEYRGVTRNVDGHYMTNTRTQIIDGESSFDYKTHYALTDNLTKLSSQNTFTEDGVTCRANSLVVITNGETRRDKTRSSC